MSGPNRSTAVMQRRVEAHDSLDDFPTPPWATRALLGTLQDRGEALHLQSAWEPACNRGYMARVLAEEFGQVHATDVHDYGWPGQMAVADFLLDWGQDAPQVDWIITNPPFRLAADFITQGLRVARRGVAVFVRAAFLEGQGRYRALFEATPPALYMPFVERVVLWQGCLLDPDVPVWDAKAGAMKKPTTATAYCWLVWRKGAEGAPRLIWVPPCRAALTRAGDYPAIPDHLLPPEGSLI